MNNEQPSIRSGEELPYLDGKNDGIVFKRSFWNKIIAICNAVLRTRNWTVTENGIAFRQGKVGNSPNGGSGSFRGEYSTVAIYASQDIVVISFGAAAGTYICLVDGTTGISPDTGAPNWVALPAPSMLNFA